MKEARAGQRREYLCENTTSRMADSEDLLLNKAKEDQTGNRIVKVNSGKHYFCGYCAAITNIAVTFPIQKVLFRQQLYGVRTRDAICQLQKDGIRNLYRGILPPLMQKSTTLALMFGLYEDLSSVLLRHISAPEIFARSLAAVLAGTTEAVLTPFERVQTLLQDYKHHDKFTNTYQAFRVLREHGAREYYRGLVPILLRNGPSNALFFGLRGPIKQCLPEATTYSTHLINDFICGGVLGAMLGFMFFPVNVVKARMQSQIGGEFQSFSTVFMKIWVELEHRTILSCQFPGFNEKTLASISVSITFEKLNCQQMVVSV
ncbi:putative Solute carrier family 25 member 51 isoform X1 protein, partial [Naja naja]